MRDGLLTLFLSGDVMTGRGVDQILPHPGDPTLWETVVRDARGYVRLAESVNGPIPAPVPYDWPWGEALETLDGVQPDVRVINLETSVTRSDDAADDKAVLYRMAPENVGCLRVVQPDVCALANNHVLDFGRSGLAQTCTVLADAGIPYTGAGRDAGEAGQPVITTVAGAGRVITFSYGLPSSGIPHDWAARADVSGVNLLQALTPRSAGDVVDRALQVRRPGDLVVVSVHWGSNWGYGLSADQIEFAHRLIDGGIDVIHGHSSHHVRPIEIYRGKLVLYGCGDLINDYEGISGYESYRDDLRLLYFATVDPWTGELSQLRLVPMQARQLRLWRASASDADHLVHVINQTSEGLGVRARKAADQTLHVLPE